jgi:ABC-type multidrug transport system fused ATPase/permease subunit
MSLIGLMCKLFSYGKDTKSLLCFSLILSFILGLIIPCMSYVSALIYDSLFNLTSVIYFESGLSQRKNSLYSFVGFSVAFLFLAFFQILSSYIFGNKVSKDIRQLLYNKFLKLSVSWY